MLNKLLRLKPQSKMMIAFLFLFVMNIMTSPSLHSSQPTFDSEDWNSGEELPIHVQDAVRSRYQVYKLAKKNHNCALHGITQNPDQNVRETVFNKIIERARDEYSRHQSNQQRSHILNALRSSILNENNEDRRSILGISQVEAANLYQNSHLSWSRHYFPYLKYYRNSTEMIQCISQFNAAGESFNVDRPYTLLDPLDKQESVK